ncbi:MAG: DUF3604 domain-containing protein, partial [Myxococcota bacterium]|nr:DUF3604 domain-containing protein [Myxococcota bacterium]
SINDHAEASSPRKWRNTVDSIRQCNAVAGDDPDTVAFLGWEWTQVGRTPKDHWGHKNVILRDLDDGAIPTRPIGAGGLATDGLRGRIEGTQLPWPVPLLDFEQRQPYFDFAAFLKEIREVPFCPEDVPANELPGDCYEFADEPVDLFRKLDEWGIESMVIPHGNTWGFYSPAGTSWDKQLTAAHDDPSQQFLIEVMSGHGNSEEYRSFRAVAKDENGDAICPEPSPGYLPSCWRAGQLIEERCLADGDDADECAARAAETRALYVAAGQAGAHVVQGESMEEWLDSGQCTDCFRPSFNYRPAGSTQYALALGGFEEDEAEPRRFRFGILASSDNHRARPGTGYKPVDRKLTTEANGARDEFWQDILHTPEDPSPTPVEVDPLSMSRGFAAWETERQASFFMTGGLAAVHSEGRTREEIWDALERKEVYGTSGERILLWFHLLNAERPDGSFGSIPMGSEVTLAEAPRFEVRAVGAFVQEPGCGDETGPLSPERLQQICRGECYRPSEERRLITRIEVIRIRPQSQAGEPIDELIEDPWRRFDCEPDPAGCVVRFHDPEFTEADRESVYYVRAVQEPTPVINADNLRCERDESGACTEVRPCYGEEFKLAGSETCAAPSEERAWSSPIFVVPGGGSRVAGVSGAR